MYHYEASFPQHARFGEGHSERLGTQMRSTRRWFIRPAANCDDGH
jgi:hypothetical protein